MNASCTEADFQRLKAKLAANRAANLSPATPPAEAVGEAIQTAAHIERAVAAAIATVNKIPAVQEAGTVKLQPRDEFRAQVAQAGVVLDLAERTRGFY